MSDGGANSSVIVNNTVTRQIFSHAGFIAYGTVMSLILSFGFLGNTLTLVALAHRDHRYRNITPYLVNNAVANLFIVVFGYPVAISANLRGKYLLASNANCNWSSFVNGTTGIASIITLATLSFVLKLNVARWNRAPKWSLHKSFCVIVGIWLYSVGLMAPPLLGWNRFVPGSAGFSCCPDWSSREATDLSYNAFLVFMGFVVPLTVIVYSYSRILRFVRPPLFVTRRGKYRIAHGRCVVKMTLFAIIAFMVSWTPYCALSVAAMIEGKYVTSLVWAQYPELMAKASVVYNPLILIVTYTGFRKTVYKIVCRKSADWTLLRRKLSRMSNSSNEPRESRV